MEVTTLPQTFRRYCRVGDVSFLPCIFVFINPETNLLFRGRDALDDAFLVLFPQTQNLLRTVLSSLDLFPSLGQGTPNNGTDNPCLGRLFVSQLQALLENGIYEVWEQLLPGDDSCGVSSATSCFR